MGRLSLLLALCIAAGCAGARSEPEPLPDPDDPAYAARFDEPTDSRVSTSRGDEDGVTVLWPRVVPAAGADALSSTAAALQDRMRAMAVRALPGRPLDVRPDPERSCPSAGCAGMAFGAILAHSDRGCAVVAAVARRGQSPFRLVPWSDGVRLRQAVIPFREPPESSVGVSDFLPCDDLDALLGGHESDVQAALVEVAGE